ncbi:MAG TPA: signal peptidase II [Bacteriovoracaceae bacterium]|nr:signal peptidase II [Bacteriovoracaceae bacterium]
MRLKMILNPTILVGCVLIDQFSKEWGRDLTTLHFNEGFIMGYYSYLPASIRIVALGSFSGFILLIYTFLMYVLSSKARFFKYGISLLVGGIFGNVIDKIVMGKTVDFIPLPGLDVVFNMADVFQWLGVAVMIWFMFAKEKLLWHPSSSRQRYLVRPKEQLKMALQFSLIAFCCSLLLGIFSFTFFNTLFGHLYAHDQKLKLTFFITYCSLSLLFCSLVFLMGIVISHRTAGPLYAFEMYVEDLLANKDRKLTLRDGDNYRHFEQVADKLRDKFKS